MSQQAQQEKDSQEMDVTFTDSEPSKTTMPFIGPPNIDQSLVASSAAAATAASTLDTSIPMPLDQNEISNNSIDDIYYYDERQQADIRMAKPWDREPNYFTHIKISVHALLKMLRHAKKGGNLEIMGMLLGKVATSTMIVMDSFALPVEGTETRVNAHAQAYEYMADYCELSKKVDRKEHVIGWYHSHPGYGCWLSGIDCGTQILNQQFQDPFVAIVIDPIRTISTGKVDIGAFRTYPKNFKPTDDLMPEYESIPMNKIEDFGVHCRKYYSLEISYFKSDLDNYLLDCLANKYWYNTLGTTSLTTKSEYTTRQLTDLSERLEQAETRLSKSAGGSSKWLVNEQNDKKQQEEALSKITGDCAKAVIEPITGLMALVVKDTLFNYKANTNTGSSFKR